MGERQRLLAGLCAVLMLGACSTSPTVVDRRQAPSVAAGGAAALWPQPSNRLTGESPGSWWAGAAQADLAPTGLEVVVRPGAQTLVVDGSGSAWLQGPWHLVRVDPSTGAAQTWDVGDDPTFGEVLGIRRSAQAAVWLILRDRIRLFDGDRFVRDVPVPAELRGGPEGEVVDLVEVGAEVWIAGPAGVARWTGGGWGLVRPEQLTGVRALAVDRVGDVWAAGQLSGGDRRRWGVVRFEAAGWAEPPSEGAPNVAHRLVAHPVAGIVALYGSDVRWFDGTAWQAFPLAGMGLGIGALGARVLALTEDGAAWLLGDQGLARGGPDGWVALPHAGPPLVGVASAGEEALVADGTSLYRVDGEAFTQVWSEVPKGPVASRAAVEEPGVWWGPSPWAAGSQLAVEPEGLAAVSADEVWALNPTYPFPLRYSAGAWQEVPVSLVLWPVPVPASDGAVWLGTTKGLVRISGADRTTITSVPSGGSGRAGPDGSVLVLPSEWYGWWYADGYEEEPPEYIEIQRIGAGGDVTPLELPVDRWSLTEVVAGPDGQVWATACASGWIEPCPTPAELFRWDGGWAPVPYPGSNVTPIGVAPDGALWARIDPRAEPDAAGGGDTVLARHADGRWATVLDSGVPDQTVVAPNGSVCGIDGASAALACVDDSGRITTWPVGVTGEIRIGLDGSVWLAHGGLVARLPISLAD